MIVEEIDLEPVKERLCGEGFAATRRLLASHIMEDCDRYVPYRTGALHDNRLVNDDGTELEWSEDYAKAVYNRDGANFTRPNPGGTDPHAQWAEYAKSRHMREWERFLAKEVCR